MSPRKPPHDFPPNESPIARFAEVLIAIDRTDFNVWAQSQHQLDRLGWRVTQQRSRQFVGAYLAQEEQVSPGELEQIRRLCDEVRKVILDSSELPKSLRTWLLDLVRAMRDGIDRYQIRGTRGLRHQLKEALGSVLLHNERVKEAQKKAPTIWMKLMDSIARVEKISRLLQHAMKAVGVVTKVMEYVSEISSPSQHSK